jgi:putative flippase GtrA
MAGGADDQVVTSLATALRRNGPRMEAILARWASPARRVLVGQFIRFGIVGTVGFVADTGIVYATRHAIGIYGAGVVAFAGAVTVTWLLNRVWTFRGLGSAPMHRQWAMFAATNSLGFVLNRGTFFILVTVSTLCRAQPVIAVAAGCLAGMLSNFHLSRRLVFR